jgi:hypothetical protein
MDHDRLLQIIQAMLVGFKLEIAKMRSEGATQAEIDFMQRVRKLRLTITMKANSLWRFSDKLLGSPASCPKFPITV